MRYLPYLFFLVSCNYHIHPHSAGKGTTVRVLSATQLYRHSRDKVFTVTDSSAVYSYIHQSSGKLITLQFDTTNIYKGQNSDFVNYFLHMPPGETFYEFNVWLNGDTVRDRKVYTNFEITMFKVTRKVKSM